MVAPIILKGQLFWTVTAAVGRSAPNKQEDVDFVQFGFHAMADNPKSRVDAELKATIKAIKTGTACLGREDDPLVRSIVMLETKNKRLLDGIVSVVKGDTGSYSDRTGKHHFLCIVLCNNLIDMSPDIYPRLDMYKTCPPGLKTAVKRAINF